MERCYSIKTQRRKPDWWYNIVLFSFKARHFHPLYSLTITDIVEKNLKKFKIDESELEDRRSFIRRTRVSVKSMKDNLSSKQTKGKDETNVRQALLSNGPNRPHDKYTRLDQEMERSNQRYIEDTSQQQQLIMRTQDDNMDLISKSVGSLKNMSQQIGNELEEQNVMLDEFHTEMDHTESRMDVTMKKLAKVMHMSNDKRQWCGIFVLIGILIDHTKRSSNYTKTEIVFNAIGILST
ncbi:STX6 [Mytilus coruscus]|uniref:STX6 n=1 Tax=Mytilus coruscus TaxID=42192 RepID=A0A6J8EMG3_MYTCO|nr:STX6 [Mytilus coruscus]